MEEKPGTYRLPNGNYMTPYGEQGESGFDIAQIRANLKRTPEERLLRLQSALRFFSEGDKVNDRLRRIHQNS